MVLVKSTRSNLNGKCAMINSTTVLHTYFYFHVWHYYYIYSIKSNQAHDIPIMLFCSTRVVCLQLKKLIKYRLLL